MKTNYPNMLFTSSIDFICVSMMRFDKKQHQLINNHCTLIKRYRKHNGFYYWIEKYRISINGNEYTIMVQYPSSTNPQAPVCLKLLHPNMHLIQFFNSLFRAIPYHVSMVELSFDFITNHLNSMYDYLKERVYLKWPGAQLYLNHKTTTYYNNIRKARGKGCRLYIKQTGIPTPAVRLELLLKRDPLRKNGINQLQDICLIDHKIVKKYLELKDFDFRLFNLRYMKENKNNKFCFKNYGRLEKRIVDLIDDGKLHTANSLSKQYVRYPNLKECSLNKVFFERIDVETMLN